MKTYPLSTAVALFLLTSSCATSPKGTPIGRDLSTCPRFENKGPNSTEDSRTTGTISDFTLKDIHGCARSLSDYLGTHVIVMSFWSFPCEPCKREMVHLQKLYDEYRDNGLVILSIATDDSETVGQARTYVEQRGYTFPVLFDSDTMVTDRFNTKKTEPFTLLIDRDERIVWHHTGYVPGDEKALEAQIRNVL